MRPGTARKPDPGRRRPRRGEDGRRRSRGAKFARSRREKARSRRTRARPGPTAGPGPAGAPPRPRSEVPAAVSTGGAGRAGRRVRAASAAKNGSRRRQALRRQSDPGGVSGISHDSSPANLSFNTALARKSLFLTVPRGMFLDLRDLLVGQAREMAQGDQLAKLGRQLLDRRGDRLSPLGVAQQAVGVELASSCTPGRTLARRPSGSGLSSGTVRGRRLRRWSIAALPAIRKSHVENLYSGLYRSSAWKTFRKISWARSSASSRLPTIRATCDGTRAW